MDVETNPAYVGSQQQPLLRDGAPMLREGKSPPPGPDDSDNDDDDNYYLVRVDVAVHIREGLQAPSLHQFELSPYTRMLRRVLTQQEYEEIFGELDIGHWACCADSLALGGMMMSFGLCAPCLCCYISSGNSKSRRDWVEHLALMDERLTQRNIDFVRSQAEEQNGYWCVAVQRVSYELRVPKA